MAQAVKLLTEEWLGDFPFASPADKANAIAVPLTMTGRMFFTLVPLFVFDASTAGSGKGLLVTTISLIATGEPPQVMELPADGEEQRKKITSALLAGQELIMWDESHVIAGRTLAAILTAEKYSDRLLGGNKLISVVNRFTQVALGNNVEVWGDMKRRVVPSRLVPDTEHPEHRDRLPPPRPRAVGPRAPRRAARRGADDLAELDRQGPAGGGRRDGQLRAVGPDSRRRAPGGRDQGLPLQHRRVAVATPTTTTAGATTSRQLRARFGDEWFTVGDVADAVEAGYLKRPPLKRDPDKTTGRSSSPTPTGRSARSGTVTCGWSGPTAATRRPAAAPGQWCNAVQQTPEPSSGSSGSSGDADHADHPEDANPVPERITSCIACDRPAAVLPNLLGSRPPRASPVTALGELLSPADRDRLAARMRELREIQSTCSQSAAVGFVVALLSSPVLDLVRPLLAGIAPGGATAAEPAPSSDRGEPSPDAVGSSPPRPIVRESLSCPTQKPSGPLSAE